MALGLQGFVFLCLFEWLRHYRGHLVGIYKCCTYYTRDPVPTPFFTFQYHMIPSSSKCMWYYHLRIKPLSFPHDSEKMKDIQRKGLMKRLTVAADCKPTDDLQWQCSDWLRTLAIYWSLMCYSGASYLNQFCWVIFSVAFARQSFEWNHVHGSEFMWLLNHIF